MKCWSRWLIASLFAIIGIGAVSQTTTVSATVLDPNGVRYANGTVTAQMALASPAPTPLPLLTTVSGTLDVAGAFSIVLTSSQTYNFSICAPAPSFGPRAISGSISGCFAVTNVAISGATQDLTATLNAASVVLGGLPGLDFLGSVSCAATCSSTSVLTFSPRSVLVFLIDIASYPSADIGSIRFNNDSAANYWDRHLTTAAGGTVATDVPNASTTLIRLAGNAVNQGRSAIVVCMNLPTRSKSCSINIQTLTGAAATVGLLDYGAGEWVNTTVQISSVQLIVSGAGTMGAGSGIAVFGKSF